MGLPDYRCALGTAFSPPLLRFSDRQLPATVSAAAFAPWSIDDHALISAVEETTHRHRQLRDADTAARLGNARIPFEGADFHLLCTAAKQCSLVHENFPVHATERLSQRTP